ncbi:carboxypeptidase-like regulatory domain-containing protein [Joostella atrarenae]|uniref:Carboxypeptidase-like regulatory domain-containing protein n=1 Tax=Joostella atrarenae TaxID=679257 RepID=A0ABS9J1A7_9FLAO|nr:carboxypeptidase-like regulatory domain-containing protein [Joostella atrarenae]MCF8714218.1 carboxypeptidase-like regulatory domain-containing protein [Joostella atrarenae]
MKKLINIKPILFLLFLLCTTHNMFAFQVDLMNSYPPDSLLFKEYKGVIIDDKTGDELVFATLTIEDTNISSITNSEGEFALKVPDSLSSSSVLVSFLGYKERKIPISSLQERENEISLIPVSIELMGIDVTAPKDALELVKRMLKKKGDNYIEFPVKMTAFYRETIKKRNKDASLSEAVAYIYKQPNSSGKKDYIELYKSRKSTDYHRLDTVALKLQGGPFTPLYVDIMKYPEYIFTEDLIKHYDFKFTTSTTINEEPVYVVSFKQKEGVIDPLFYGKIYISSKSEALMSAVFNLNVDNKELVSDLLVRSKPNGIDAYPTEALYRVDYRINEGKYYYGYGNVQLAFVVDRKGKLFNSKYFVSSEMAITDWEESEAGKDLRYRDRMKSSIIIVDEASGFSDPEFWGAYNVIEPEKSIESAINKIQKQLERDSD